MQATIFDFTFRLREREKEIYISRSTSIVMSQGFRMILVGNHPRNFSMRSAVGDTGATQEMANEVFALKGTPYNRAIFFGDGVFALSADEGYNYTPRILLRKSLYYGVIVGRMLSKKGFITTDRRFLVRRSVLPKSLDPYLITRRVRHKNSPTAEVIVVDQHKTAIWKNNDILRIEADGELLSTIPSIYPRMIEGRTRKVQFFKEKISFKSYRFGNVSFLFTPSERDFSGIRFIHSFALSITETLSDFNGLKKKYVIISLEKNIIKAKGLRSKPSRFLIKG